MEWSPAVERSITDLERRVGDELRDSNGELMAWALPPAPAIWPQSPCGHALGIVPHGKIGQLARHLRLRLALAAFAY